MDTELEAIGNITRVPSALGNIPATSGNKPHY